VRDWLRSAVVVVVGGDKQLQVWRSNSGAASCRVSWVGTD